MAAAQPSEPDRDKTLDDSFPSSDPPANSGVTGSDRPDKPSHERTIEEKPTATPTRSPRDGDRASVGG